MRIERNKNIWDFHLLGNPIVITTNTVVKKNRSAVMEAGIAKQAADKYPDLPKIYGEFLEKTPLLSRSKLFHFGLARLILFPTKYAWRNPSDLNLIEINAKALVELTNTTDFKLKYGEKDIYLPALGCNLGRLKWEQVNPIISPVLDDRFVVILND